MNKLKRGSSRIPRKVRIVIDLFLILILLGVYYIALGSPLSGEEARFRRAEKAYLVGPSEILETINVSSAWTQPAYDYNRMIIGDDGDEILFYTFKVGKGTSSMDGVITRRQKADGILLTPIPMDTAYAIQRMEDELFQSLPLFLFVDDPAAVKATIGLKLSDTYEVTLTSVRGEEADASYGFRRMTFFEFDLPVTNDMVGTSDAELLVRLASTNSHYDRSADTFPVTIRLYDIHDELINEIEYIIKSRAYEE